MFRRFLILLLALASPGLAMAMWSRKHAVPTESVQFAIAASSEGQTAIPGLFVPNQIIDLGSIAPTGKVDATFKFENRSHDKSVAIIAVTPQCGCTAVRMGKQDIPPGAMGSVTVELDAMHAGLSPFRKSISVWAKESDQTRKVTLYLIGTVGSAKEFLAFTDFLNFAKVFPGQHIGQTILFRGGPKLLEELPSKIEIELGKNRNITLASRPESQDFATRAVELKINIPADAPIGEGPLTSILSLIPEQISSKQVAITIIGNPSAIITASPIAILIDLGPDGSGIQKFSVDSLGKIPFTIREISSNLPLDFRYSEGADSSHGIVIQGRHESNMLGSHSGYVKIEFEGGFPPLFEPIVLEYPNGNSTRPAVEDAKDQLFN